MYQPLAATQMAENVLNAMNKTTVIHHSADFDGLFCRQIARKFLPPDTEFIGWDFGDDPLKIPNEGTIYILDLPVDRVFGYTFVKGAEWPREGIKERIIWIDHHKTSIKSHPTDIPGYRIEGVAACRLAWQWFTHPIIHSHTEILRHETVALKQAFVDRTVIEPLAVRLAGEYDIWDKRDPRAELFQHGLRSRILNDVTWKYILGDDRNAGEQCVADLLENGKVIQFVRDNEYRDVITGQGFDMEFEGLKFLACCSHECDIRSHLFAAGLKPEHDACFGFTYTGKVWRVSMYHAPGKEHHDLSKIAKRYGGGGHPGACGMLLDKLPWMP